MPLQEFRKKVKAEAETVIFERWPTQVRSLPTLTSRTGLTETIDTVGC